MQAKYNDAGENAASGQPQAQHHSSGASTKEALELHAGERNSIKQAKEYNNELKGLRQRYHGMDSDLKISKLRKWK